MYVFPAPAIHTAFVNRLDYADVGPVPRFVNVINTRALAPGRGSARAGRKLPANSLVIPFDDGYRDNYTTVWPILAEHGFSATIFLVAGRMGLTSNWRKGALSQNPLLSWAEAREMAEAGICFGSHTTRHADLAALDLPKADRELHQARTIIEQALGRLVNGLAYPYNRFTPAVQAIAQLVKYIEWPVSAQSAMLAPSTPTLMICAALPCWPPIGRRVSSRRSTAVGVCG